MSQAMFFHKTHKVACWGHLADTSRGFNWVEKNVSQKMSPLGGHWSLLAAQQDRFLEDSSTAAAADCVIDELY